MSNNIIPFGFEKISKMKGVIISSEGEENAAENKSAAMSALKERILRRQEAISVLKSEDRQDNGPFNGF